MHYFVLCYNLSYFIILTSHTLQTIMSYQNSVRFHTILCCKMCRHKHAIWSFFKQSHLIFMEDFWQSQLPDFTINVTFFLQYAFLGCSTSSKACMYTISLSALKKCIMEVVWADLHRSENENNWLELVLIIYIQNWVVTDYMLSGLRNQIPKIKYF